MRWHSLRSISARQYLNTSIFPPLIRTVAVLVKKKIACNSLARAVSKDDFQKFDYIFGM